MTNSITYSNNSSTVVFTFSEGGDRCDLIVNGKKSTVSGSKAEAFALSLEEAGYEVVG